MSDYIVVSCKEWHKTPFKSFVKSMRGNWLYVDSTAKLSEVLQSTYPRYVFFLHWNWIVPADICAKFECVCFHMTDVPYGRGGSPLQNLILRGHKKTKLSALRMTEIVDAGPVYAKCDMELEGRAEDIYLRAGQLCWEIIRWITENEPSPSLQHGDITIFERRKPDQSMLPASGSLESLNDHIRMVDAPSYPLAFIEHGEFRLEFSHAELRDGEIQARVVIRKNGSG
ncbi:methionyl-tRNA formyltransferase [Alphaproteobacteria bacterium]|nr:methionyl-tRNA formyltransferase [Alphaproteobacteria bacterium]